MSMYARGLVLCLSGGREKKSNIDKIILWFYIFIYIKREGEKARERHTDRQTDR